MQEMYVNQRYWLVWRGGKGQAVLAEEFEPKDVIQILWQAGAQPLLTEHVFASLQKMTQAEKCSILQQFSLQQKANIQSHR